MPDFVKTALKSLWNRPNNYHLMKMEGKNYINGKWSTTETGYYNINPSTGESLGTFPSSGPMEVEIAVEVARRTFYKWKKVS